MLYKIKLAKKIFLLVLLFQITSTVTLFADNREQNNDKITYLLLEAQRLEQTHNPDSLVAAFEMLKAAIKDDNLNQDARFKLSSYYYKMNMPDKYYDNILLAAYSDTTNYYYNIVAADNAQKIGDYEMATEIYERLIRNYPNDESLYTMMANLYLEQADIEKAIECYNKVERLTDNTEYAAFARADVYLYLKQYDNAASEFKRLLKNDSTNITYLLSLSQLYIQIDSLS
ncbi:MAG: tetratricopeptide repeat protein, partial [Coprobacter sp.]|nr:tetratricopeptide repeat protein [Coprobacter sp.]